MSNINLSMSIDTQFDVLNSKVTSTKRELHKANNEIKSALKAKEEAAAHYKKVVNDAILADKSFALVHKQVIREYAKTWCKNKGVSVSVFLKWVDDNNKLDSLDEVKDTQTKCDTLLMNLYKSFIKGKEIARRTQEEINEDKKRKEDLFAQMLAASSVDELKELAEAKAKENK